jgi:hypothetical protein
MMRYIKTPGKLLELLSKHAIAYAPKAGESICRNHHMNDITEDDSVNEKTIEATLVDFINYIGSQYGVDYGMTTSDLPPGPLDRIAEAASE